MSGGFGIGAYSAMPFGAGGAETRVWAWSPYIGAPLGRTDVIEFNVTNDAWPLDDVQLYLAFTLSGREMVFTNGRFTERFWRGSHRVVIDNGHHYILRRTGGWEGAVVGVSVIGPDVADVVVSGQSP